jgi:hypothetical protein
VDDGALPRCHFLIPDHALSLQGLKPTVTIIWLADVHGVCPGAPKQKFRAGKFHVEMRGSDPAHRVSENKEESNEQPAGKT